MIDVSASCLPVIARTPRGSDIESSVSQRILFTLRVAGRSFLFAAPLRFAVVVLCGIGLGSIGGCNNSDRPAMGKVHGRVTLDGKPLAGATVVFAPAVRGLRHSDGVTNENGEYILKYIREEMGATVGKNSVRITKLRTHAASSDVVPAKYNRETTLTAEVTSGNNVCDFPLTSK
jgi:hypothetical protein